MVRHRSGTALVDWADQLDDLFRFDLPRQLIAAERVRKLVETFSVSFENGLLAALSGAT